MTDEEKKLQDQQNLANPDFGTGSMLTRPEEGSIQDTMLARPNDSSIQGASDDFMSYLQNPTEDMAPEQPEMDNSQIQNYDEMLKQDALSKSMLASKLGASRSPALVNTRSSKSIAASPQSDILAKLKAARDANTAGLANARQADKLTELNNTIAKSGAQIGQGLVNRAGNTNVKLEADQVAANQAKQTQMSNQDRIQSLLQDYSLGKGMEDTAYSRKFAEQARQDKLAEQQFEHGYKNKMLELASLKANVPKASEGQKSIDRSFAKDYNEWETKGREQVNKNFNLLQDAVNKLESKKGNLDATSGRFVGMLPDVLRTEESKAIRDNVHKAVQATLRATLGSQFTEREGERIMNSSYNENLSPEENIKKIKSTMAELSGDMENMEKRSNYFVDNNGSLKGLKGTKSNITKQNISSEYPKTVYNQETKKQATVSNSEQEQQANAKGFR